MDAVTGPTAASAYSLAHDERRLRVFVLSDVRLYSEGLAALLAAVAAIRVVGASAVDVALSRRLAESVPDVLLVDAAALRASDAVQRLAVEHPAMLVVAYGVSEEPDEVIACAQRGAAGYVPRDASVADLVEVLWSVDRGELLCSPRIASTLFRRVAALGEPGPAPAAALTTREREVIGLIDRGLSNKEIAATLSIEVATVKNHVHHVLEKLDVPRRSAAAARLRSATWRRS